MKIWWAVDGDRVGRGRTIIWTDNLNEAREAVKEYKKNLSREERENIEIRPIGTSRKYFNKK